MRLLRAAAGTGPAFVFGHSSGAAIALRAAAAGVTAATPSRSRRGGSTRTWPPSRRRPGPGRRSCSATHPAPRSRCAPPRPGCPSRASSPTRRRSAPTTPRRRTPNRQTAYGSVSSGRNRDAIIFWMTDVVRWPDQAPAQLDGAAWVTALEPLARTLRYDLAVTAGGVPAAELATITAPVLILGGSNSPAWFRRSVAEQAAATPGARLMTLDGYDHNARRR